MELSMIEVLGFVADKLPWIAAGYLMGAGTRLEVTRVAWWFMNHGIRARDDRGRPGRREGQTSS